MNLNKWLRKNTRVLLMVFMSFLLVAFLVPSQIQGCGDRGSPEEMELGEVYGRTIVRADVLRYGTELRLVQMLGLVRPPLQYMIGDPLAFGLLMDEAAHKGISLGRDEVKRVLQQGGVTDDVLQQLRETTHLSYDQMYDTVDRWLAVQWLAAAQASVVGESLPREELMFRDQNQQAVTRMAVVDAAGLLHAVPEPTEEELQAFFDECKARTTETTEKELIYGYRLPDRVKVEYLTVDPEQVKRKVRVKASEVERYYEENRNRYTKPDPTAPPTPGGRPVTVPMTLEEARDQAREDCRLAKAVELAQRQVNELYEEISPAWRNAPLDEAGFHTAPPGPPISFIALRDKYADRMEIAHGQTTLTDIAALRNAAPDLTSAVLGSGQQRISVVQLVKRVQGILDKNPDDGQPVLSVNEPAPVVVRADPAKGLQSYQAYLFRVTAVAPNAPPDSLSEVRDKLVADWKDKRAFELAQEYAEKLAEQARTAGLDTAVADDSSLKDALAAGEQAASPPTEDGTPPPRAPQYVQDLEPFTPQNVTRNATFIAPRVGRTQDVPAAVFDMADNPPTTPHAVACVPQANTLRWVVVEFQGLKPLYEGEFQQQAAQLAASGQQARQYFLFEWFMPDSVAKRTGFKSKLPPATPAEETP